jgi:hypothetical protein
MHKGYRWKAHKGKGQGFQEDIADRLPYKSLNFMGSSNDIHLTIDGSASGIKLKDGVKEDGGLYVVSQLPL